MPKSGQSFPIPAPFGGLNTREGIAALQPNEARQLDNWRCEGGKVKKRPGATSHSTGLTASAEIARMGLWRGATTKILAFSGGRIWDISSDPASEVHNGSYTDDSWSTVTTGGVTIGVNGTDTPFSYDGTTVSGTGFTGPSDLTKLSVCEKVGTRIWFGELGSDSAWYTSAGGVTGALTEFDLGQVVKGGTLFAVGSHSMDAGDGPDDYTVFLMDDGQIAVYSGDPAATFTLVGIYSMPAPISKHGIVKIGGQLAVLTRMGLVPIQAAMKGVAFDFLALGDFGKVAPSIRDDVAQTGASSNWQLAFHDGDVIINSPLLSGEVSQWWVFNTTTGNWSRDTERYSASIMAHNGTLYIGHWTDATIYKATGPTDVGTAITTRARCAFGRPGGADRRWRATAIRFDLTVEGDVSGRFAVDRDLQSSVITIASKNLNSSTGGTAWGSAWGSAWSEDVAGQNLWHSTSGEGYNLAPAVEMSSSAGTLEWYQTRLMVKGGRTL